jgi:uncharacterized protein (TIGR02246 family)
VLDRIAVVSEVVRLTKEDEMTFVRCRRIAWVLLPFPLGGCTEEPPPPMDQAAQEQVIKDLDTALSEAAQEQDAATFGSFFAEDGVQMPPNAAPLEGRAAVEQSAADLFGGGGELRFETLAVRVSGSGDMAYSRGKYYLNMPVLDGLVRDEGSYLEVWQKIDGEWRITADCFNSDLPAN